MVSNSEEYQIVNEDELKKLRSEVEQIKKNPLQDMQSSLTLIESMDRLATQVERLVQLFDQANKELYDEYSEGFKDDAKKLDKLITQNEKIAKGVLAVADLVQRTPSRPSEAEKPSEQSESGMYPLEENEESNEPVSRRHLMKNFR